MHGRRLTAATAAVVTAGCFAAAMTAATTTAAAASTASAGDPGTFVSTAPTRLLDTRLGKGGAQPAARGTVHLQVDGVGPVPSSGVAAVVLNVTVTSPTAGGYVTVYADTASRPTASNLNFAAHQTVPNLVVAPMGTDGKVALYNGSSGMTQLIADVAGYYLGVPGTGTGTAPTDPGAFVPTAPTRLLDTRNATGGSTPAARGTVHLQVDGAGPVPGSNVAAVVLNVTVTAPTAHGYVTVYGDGAPQPAASNLNFAVGQTVPNLVVAPVGSDGMVALYNGSGGPTQLIADVAGYYLGGIPTAAGAFVTTPPTRLLDTRTAIGGGQPGPAATVPLQVDGRLPVPSAGVAAVVLNVTVTSPTAGGYVTVYADTAPKPTASNLNFRAGQTVPNLVVAPVGTNGKVALYNGSGGSTQLLGDVAGYFLAANTPTTGAVTGTVTSTATPGAAGAAVAGVGVRVSSGGTLVGSATTGSAGTYSVDDVLAGSGYVVCFVAPAASTYQDECYDGVAWTGGALPAGTTPVDVSAGAAHTGVDATLAQPPGSISGTVTAENGQAALAGVTVSVYGGTTVVGTATTNGAGVYSIAGLAAGNGYVVCFDARSATGGSSGTGYLSQCYSAAPWTPGAAPPTGATAVTVPAGGARTGVDAALAAGGTGSIAGTVTAVIGGAGIGGVKVVAFDLAGTGPATAIGTTTTSSTGSYTLSGVPPSAPGYLVCFDASSATGAAATGYQDRCYDDVAWDGSSSRPAGATAVPVAGGQAVTGVDDVLPSAASISGTVSFGPTGIAGVRVLVYSAATGDPAGYAAVTSSSGTYTVSGLPPQPSGYDVCFDASHATGGASVTGYQSQCFNNVGWDAVSPLPAGVTAVRVSTAGSAATGIDGALIAGGAISGTVTGPGSAQLGSVRVHVFTATGSDLGSAATAANGSYRITALLPSTTGYAVCFDGSAGTGGSSAGGYLSECNADVGWSGDPAEVPGSATLVPVSAGGTRTVNATLAPAGAIAGTVTGPGGTPVANARVLVLDDTGTTVGAPTATRADGSYAVRGLPSTTGYTVCFDAAGATGSASTGYLDQCYNNLPWTGNPADLPTGTASVSVSAGSATSVSAVLAVAGAITGTVTASADGSPLAQVTVEVFDDNGGRLATARSGANGSYAVTGLPSSSGYPVCFFADDVSGGPSTTGYLDQCFQSTAWDGSVPLPAGVTTVAVTAGSTSAGIDAALDSGGAIAGTVTASAGHAALGGVAVHVYDAAGAEVGDTDTSGTGAYEVTVLQPGSYTVCFDGSVAGGGASAGGASAGYASQCYNGKSWSAISGLPASGANPVTVAVGTVRGGIDAALARAGGISGRVTADADGAGIGGIQVQVFDPANPNSGFVGYVYTGNDGTYAVSGLTPSTTGYDVCVAGDEAGFADECYTNVAWDGFSPPSSAATAVPVSAGAVHGGIDVGLAAGG